jgi:hypothetical protein
MATIKIQHPTLERVVYDVPDESVSDWESAGWKVLDDTEEAAEGREATAPAADAPAAEPAPLTETQGSDSPPETPATGGPTKTTRKAV